MEELHQTINLTAAERAAGGVIEIEVDGEPLLCEYPAGVRVGALLRLRRGSRSVLVEVRDRQWGLDGGTRRDLAPRGGAVVAERSFWERAVEELVESRRVDREFAGAVYAEQRGDRLVLTGLHRSAVGGPGGISYDSSWGSLLWHTSSGIISSTRAFGETDALIARHTERPLITLSHTVLSPAVAANFIFPVGARTLMLVAGLQGLLALDRRTRRSPLLLGRAVAARIVYPDGSVALVGHASANLARELFDRAAFAVDRTLGQAQARAQKKLRELVEQSVFGRPPRS
ncbi:MAG: hypothetical protein JXR83_06380 [Deltaproteobacteria bacterium]|nr:hypothetical protein [Deltaproteobacteria bacterium]